MLNASEDSGVCQFDLLIILLLVHVSLLSMLTSHDRFTPNREDTSGNATVLEQQGNILQLESPSAGVEEDHGDEARDVYSEGDKSPPFELARVLQLANLTVCDNKLYGLQEALLVCKAISFTERGRGNLRTVKTAIQFHPEAIACILELTRVVDSLGWIEPGELYI